jgi:hypothetical protein
MLAEQQQFTTTTTKDTLSVIMSEDKTNILNHGENCSLKCFQGQKDFVEHQTYMNMACGVPSEMEGDWSSSWTGLTLAEPR